jgi:hypothetical protein
MGTEGTRLGPRGVERTGQEARLASLQARAEELDPGYRARVAASVQHAEIAVQHNQIVPRQQARQIDGAVVLNYTRRYLAHYVAFPSESALNAAVGWIAHAVARDRDDKGIGQLIWRASPRLLATSRNRGSGKSTLLDLIVILTRSRDGKLPKVTPRGIAEVLGLRYEVAALDEAKTIFGSGAKSLELQGILLAGYTPRSSYRVQGKSIPLFGAVAYAGKDELITDTNGGQIGDLLDRSIILRMRAPDTVPPEVGEQAEDDGDLLAAALIAWTDSCRDELRDAARDLAAEAQEARVAGNLRSSQIWRPLKAIGRVAGGGWEEDIDCAEEELTAGAGGIEAAETMDELARRADAWGVRASDEPGVIVTEPGDEEEL